MAVLSPDEFLHGAAPSGAAAPQSAPPPRPTTSFPLAIETAGSGNVLTPQQFLGGARAGHQGAPKAPAGGPSAPSAPKHGGLLRNLGAGAVGTAEFMANSAATALNPANVLQGPAGLKRQVEKGELQGKPIFNAVRPIDRLAQAAGIAPGQVRERGLGDYMARGLGSMMAFPVGGPEDLVGAGLASGAGAYAGKELTPPKWHGVGEAAGSLLGGLVLLACLRPYEVRARQSRLAMRRQSIVCSVRHQIQMPSACSLAARRRRRLCPAAIRPWRRKLATPGFVPLRRRRRSAIRPSLTVRRISRRRGSLRCMVSKLAESRPQSAVLWPTICRPSMRRTARWSMRHRRRRRTGCRAWQAHRPRKPARPPGPRLCATMNQGRQRSRRPKMRRAKSLRII